MTADTIDLEQPKKEVETMIPNLFSLPSAAGRQFVSLVAVVFVIGFASPAAAAVDGYTIGVDGMACPFCAYGIEKKLKAIDGVESLDIRIKEGEVGVTVADGGTVTPADIDNAIQEAGFAIRDLFVTGTATLEKSNSSFRAKFSSDFALAIGEYEGESGEAAIRAEVLKPQKDGERRLRFVERTN